MKMIRAMMVIGLSGITLPALAGNAADIVIYNSLRSCVDVRGLERQEVNNLIILKAEFTVKKSIQQCDCFYKVAHYTGVISGQDPIQAFSNPVNHLQEGKFRLETSRTQDLVVSSSPRLAGSNKLAVFINCDWPGG
ncbi:TPA: DUF2195 family protein [Salmonella enterica]|nr:DUF2195 family protein [Salmonella enterica]